MSVFPPVLPGRSRRPEEDPDRDKRLSEFSRGYENTPWLTLLVTLTGFLVIVPGSMVLVFLLGTALTGGRWVPYALLLGALVGVHACLRAMRYRRRHARRPRAGDHGRVARAAVLNGPHGTGRGPGASPRQHLPG
ncbi:MAG: hypothetical protein JOY82_06440 [Streptosporangiaceae bacterium]|nr:hypothetical protein [Streptosporangiaceae bacterium]MBV9854149.1 hypothetical protein [Streptosporangiaceae bacterium]